MSDEKLCHWVDCSIEPDGKSSRKLLGRDGARLWSFPDTWTDEQIQRALNFANHAYEKGHIAGRRSQMARIRSTMTQVFGGIVHDR